MKFMNKSQYTVPINRTKLYRSPVTEDYIFRDALYSNLEHSIELPLTIVSAPAGYPLCQYRCSRWFRMSVHDEPELVFMIVQNMQLLQIGIIWLIDCLEFTNSCRLRLTTKFEFL